VPADFGSFEVDLTSDVPNILTDPATGNRYLYLGVRTLSGASENGFEIWAGPPDYITTIASNVNLRNIQIINEPGSHSSQGATVFGMGNLPLNSNFDFRVDIPLIYVPAEYAGQRVFISLFDTDSGAVPPVTFSFDSVASEDWSISFGSGGTDPDGISGRCVPGGCNNQWVDPPYEITIPTLDTAACAADPGNQEVCTPFFGGRLVASYDSGFSDSYGWQIRLEGLPYLVR
jgi:hypothetical protein